MATGRLDVLLGLDAAQFITGLNRSQREAEKFQRSMVDTGKKIGAAIGAALSAGAFVNLVKGAIDAADRLNDLSKKTGVAVETLGGLGFAASQAGGDLETTVAGLGKLNKTIAEAAAGNKDASEFFQKLGIDVRDSTKNIKDAGTVYVEIADKFAKFEDGPNKAALALRAFGKSGLDQISILNEGGQALQANIDYYKQFSGVSAETARKADEFNDTLGKLGVIAKSLGTKIATDLLPILQLLASELQRTGEEGGTAFDSIGQGFSNFARNFGILAVNVKYVLTTIGKDVSERAEQLKAFFSGDFARAGDIGAAIRARGEEARREVDRQTDAIAAAVNRKPQQGIGLENLDAALRRPANRKPSAPGLAASGASDKAAQEAKKNLDLQLSTLDNFIKKEERLLDSRNNSLERAYSQDRISTKAYFDAKDAALDNATGQVAAGYQAQIDLLEQFYRDSKDQQVKLATLKEIGQAKEKQDAALAKASDEATKQGDERRKEIADYGRQVDEVRAKVLDLAGTEAAAAQAAAIRFDASNAGALSSFRREGDAQGIENLRLLKERQVGQERLNAILQKSQLIQDQLGTAEGRIQLDRERGVISELDSYTKLGDARRRSVTLLQEQADAYRDLAKEFSNPAFLAAAERIQLEIDAIAASADVLANRMRGEFKEAFQGAFEGLLNDLADGKNALDSFKNAFIAFTNDIIRNVNRIAAQSVADALFKGNGASGGAGYGTAIADFFSSFLGGQNMQGVYASGTDFVQRDGPAYLHRGERVVTAADNRKGGTGMTVQNTFVLPPGGVNRETQGQIAAMAARAIANANSRYN